MSEYKNEFLSRCLDNEGLLFVRENRIVGGIVVVFEVPVVLSKDRFLLSNEGGLSMGVALNSVAAKMFKSFGLDEPSEFGATLVGLLAAQRAVASSVGHFAPFTVDFIDPLFDELISTIESATNGFDPELLKSFVERFAGVLFKFISDDMSGVLLSADSLENIARVFAGSVLRNCDEHNVAPLSSILVRAAEILKEEAARVANGAKFLPGEGGAA